MKPNFKIQNFFLLLLLFGGVSCVPSNIYSNYDQNVVFENYKTFAWSPYHQNHTNQLIDNSIVAQNLRDNVTKELEMRGLKPDMENPDLLIDYDIYVEKKVRTETYPTYTYRYNYGGFYPYRPWGRYINPWNTGYNYGTTYRTRQVPYKEGDLIISLVDKKTNQLVWQGTAAETVNNPLEYQKRIEKDVSQIFKRFPLKPLKK